MIHPETGWEKNHTDLSQNVPLILLVDDDFIYHSITEMLLERASKPHRFLAFTDGDKALDYLRENAQKTNELPDLILLDINMPIKNGWEFLDEFTALQDQIGKKTRVSMMSSSSLDKDVQRAMGYQLVQQFVTKPITLDQLEELMVDF